MILLNAVVEVFTRPDCDWLLFIPAISALQPIGHIAEDDLFAVCLAAINDNTIRWRWRRSAFLKKRLAAARSRCSEKLDCVTNAVDGAVEIHPFASNFDVCLIHLPFAGHSVFALVELFKQ